MGAATQVVRRAKYKTSVKDPGTAGVLKMTEEKFVFLPNDPRSIKLEVDFKFIKGHKFTKEGSNKQALLNLTQESEIKAKPLQSLKVLQNHLFLKDLLLHLIRMNNLIKWKWSGALNYCERIVNCRNSIRSLLSVVY